MRTFIFLLSLILTVGLTVLSNVHNPFGTALPAMGKLLNPKTGIWTNTIPDDKVDLNWVKLRGMQEPVKVVVDSRMTPHIFAQSLNDAAVAQGYITAKYRLWQMDMSTRAVSGRLSEILGERTLSHDLNQRRRGLVAAAENTLATWETRQDEHALIEAYTLGVNQYIEKLKPGEEPLEFKLLGYQPEPWTNLKTALMLKSMAETLSGRHHDLANTNTRAILGDSLFQDLFPEHNPEQSPVIPTAQEAFKAEPPTVDTLPLLPLPSESIGGIVPPGSLPDLPEFIGSNNWAVGPSKTLNGNPILCNDPHLGLSLPSVWFEIQIHTPECNAYGVSLPGTPGIAIGFNENIAWGLTNVGQDVLDWYQLKWVDDKKTAYYLDGSPRQVDIKIEEVNIRGRRKPLRDSIKYTVWGPVPFAADSASPYQDMAMRWLALEKPTQREFYELGTFLRLMQAEGLEDYKKALTGYDNPAQNFAFASREGDIAITVNGKFPEKADQQGRFIQDGSLSSSNWKGFIPRSKIPQMVNPERGFIASANQRSTSPDYPYYYNGSFDDYRGRYINRRLEALSDITIEDMIKLQTSSYSIEAEEALPALTALLDSFQLAPDEARHLEELKAWDFQFTANLKAPTLYELFMDSLYALSFDEFYAARDSMEVRFPETWRFIQLLETAPTHPIFDQRNTPEVEQAPDLVKSAFSAAVKRLKELGENKEADWGKFNGARIMHLARIPSLSRGEVFTNGFHNAPNAVSKGHGPSWRMIVELGQEVKAYGIYPGGQSGNPASKYYDNMIETWAKGEYDELYFMKNETDLDFTPLYKLTLDPKIVKSN